MSENIQPIEKKLKQLNLIFIALLASQIFGGVLVWIAVRKNLAPIELPDAELVKVAVLIINVFFLFGVKFISYIFNPKKQKPTDLQNKFRLYFMLKIIVFIMLDVLNLINLFSYFLLKDSLLLAIYLIVIVWFYANRPTGEILKEQL